MATKPLNYVRPELIKAGIGIFIAIFVYYLVPGDRFPSAPTVAAMATIMAIWWVFEVIPLAVTSLIPLVFLPFAGLMSMGDVGSFYGKPIIFLFLGGFILALGLERSGLHKRMALRIIQFIGSKPSSLILGFMIASGFLSMWISNTASVLVMMPIGLSVIKTIELKDDSESTKLGVALMLGIAYAADMGGMSTLIGTPPNLVYTEIFKQYFPEGPEVGFLEWMIMGIPLSLLFMFFGWLLLTKVIFRFPSEQLIDGTKVIEKEISKLGPISWDETWAGIVFALAALLWMTGSDVNIGKNLHINGWRSILNIPEFGDASVAILMATLLFFIPSRKYTNSCVMDWRTARKVPWGILLLFGGGLALAGGFKESGLSELIARGFGELNIDSTIALVVIINTGLTFLTEFTSNTAMANLILPILGDVSVALQIDPRILMIPATLSASCAFMMPIASPTQAIVFGSGLVSIRQMVRAGIWFNILGIILVTTIFLTVGCLVLNLELTSLPDWVHG